MGDYVSFTSPNSQQLDFGFFISFRSAERVAARAVVPGEIETKLTQAP
ncbi:MAG TPA: hypothetical protein VMG30_20665 [Acidobacteriota bacterium]|nr:hypothetical protein [Acidobacteriota bacterium]